MTTTDVEPALRRQWAVLREWLASERLLDRRDEPSGLEAWAVGDLVVHLGFGLRMVAEVTATDREPIRVLQYVRGYASAHEQIAADTAAVSRRFRGRELEGIDELAGAAWAALDRGVPDVVLGRRGPLRREDFLLTRLVELVTHGDDLHRLLPPDRPSPVLPDALALVVDLFASGYAERTGRAAPWTGIDLVRVATGRTSSDDPALPLLQ